MAASSRNENSDPAPDERHFQTTHWSLVLAAGHRSSSRSNDALAALCRTYWYPLYAYVRRRVRDVDEAQDLTQEFFSQLLEKNLFAVAHPERGKFRAFLLTSFKNFLANEWDKAKALKRGGGKAPIPLDFQSGESRFSLEPIDDLTPDRLYDKQWVLTLLKHVLGQLREESIRAGKEQPFEHLKVFITGEAAPGGYAEAAVKLGMTEGAAKVAAHRLRQRYRALLRDEIAQTVAEPSEVDDEIRSLFATLGS
jgi:RNA polymerase sigma-70 factor (ECF subfamily)